MPKRGTPANFHRFITVPRGQWLPGEVAEVEGAETTLGYGGLRSASRGYRRGAGSRFYQLPFDSELRPPPCARYTHPLFDLCRNPLPLLTLLTQNPYWLPLRPTSYNACHVCSPLERARSRAIGLSATGNPLGWKLLREVH